MDLGIDYCYADVLLSLFRPLRQGVRRVLEICSCLLSCLLAGCLLNELGEAHSSWRAMTPARYEEGIFTTNHNDRYREEGTP